MKGKIKRIVKKYLTNNIGYKVLAIVLAFLVWLVVTNVQDPTTTRTISNITVTVVNDDIITDENYLYTIKSGSTTSITIEGKRSIVNSLTASDFEATADFEELSLTNAVPITVSLTGTAAQYSSQVKITVRTTSMVIEIEEVTAKMMDVNVSYTGTLADDTVIESAAVTPSQVKVTAPSSILDSIDHVSAIVNYADVSDGVVLRATPILYNAAGAVIEQTDDILVDTEEVTVEIDTSMIKTVPIYITTTGTPADGYTCTGVTLSFSTVTLKGDEDVLDAISRVVLPSSLLDVSGETRDLVIAVNLTEYIPAGTEIYDNNINLVVTAGITEEEEETTDAG